MGRIQQTNAKVFKGFLIRQLNLKRLVISEIEHQAMELEAYRLGLSKAKVPRNAKTNPRLAMPEEKAKTYKEVAQKFPQPGQ